MAYLMSNAWEHERHRFELQRQLNDHKTHERFEAIGVADGWRCLEVGAGGGSIARWLSDRVGASGEVVVTDIDTRFLDEISAANVSVLSHDLSAEALPDDSFDLVYARGVLVHLAARADLLGRVASAVKPGGWLVVEEGDPSTLSAGPPNPFQAIMDKAYRLGGIDLNWIRELPERMAELGLVDVTAEVHADFFQGGSTAAQFWTLCIQEFGPKGLAAGAMQQADVDEALKFLADPQSWACSWGLMGSRGRRPNSRST